MLAIVIVVSLLTLNALPKHRSQVLVHRRFSLPAYVSRKFLIHYQRQKREAAYTCESLYVSIYSTLHQRDSELTLLEIY